MTATEAKDERGPAPAVTRAVRLLGLLADARAPMTLTELAEGLSIAKSSTANICLALEAGGMVERVANGYRLGLRSAEIGGAFAAQFSQVREFYSVCEATPEITNEVVQVVLLDGIDSLYIARYEGGASMRVGTPLGSRLPAALSAAGRALLMRLSDAEVTELLGEYAPFEARTERSTTSLEGLLQRLAVSRERGWTLDEGEAFPGLYGVGVPIEGWAPGDPTIALGVAIPSSGASEERIERIASGLLGAAERLTNPFSRRRV